MVTRVCVPVVTCLHEFCFGECGESEVGVMLTCVVHKDNEHYFISFILDLMSKKK